jgi:hypothetical protein
MPPIPETPSLLHFDLDDESLLLLRHASNAKSYSSTEESSFSLSVGSIDDIAASTVSSSTLLSPLLSRIWGAYYDALTRRPLLIKSATALVLMVLADLSAQAVEHARGVYHNGDSDDGGGPIDWLRAMRFGVFGLIGAPWTHYYYSWLDAALPPTERPWTLTTAGRCIVPFHWLMDLSSSQRTGWCHLGEIRSG